MKKELDKVQKDFIKNEIVNNRSIYNKGYLKKSYSYVANKYNIDEINLREIVSEIKLEFVNKVSDKVFKNTDLTPNIRIIKKSPNLRNKVGAYWITGCSHAPWHNKNMYESTFNYLNKEVDLVGIILAGDIIDMNSLSSHDRGKLPIKGVTLDWEYSETNKFLDQIDQLTDQPITKDYLYGNHEDRYLRSIKDIDTSKYGSALQGPTQGLKLIERGYNVYEDWKNDKIEIGRYLDITHGEFLCTHSAKKTIDTYRKSTMYFHTHRFQIYMEGLVAGWNIGAGADFNTAVFGYASRAMKASWVNSSVLVTLDEDGYYHVQPLIFMNNKLIVNGKQY